MQVSGGMEYKRHPEINRAWIKFSKVIRDSGLDNGQRPATSTMPVGRTQNCTHWDLADGGFIRQDELRDLVTFCQAHHFTVIPEIQSLSHCYYLTMSHKELAEDRNAPYPDSYCPSNLRVYSYLFDIIDEIVEVFQPPLVHIGHDEWYNMCLCPRCRKRKAADLFAQDINKIYRHLKSKGIRTAMWCDCLLPRHNGNGRFGAVFPAAYLYESRETVTAADRLPKDILMLNWSNFLGDEEQHLRAKGFQQIFGNFRPDFPDWETRSQDSTLLGAEVSTWVGVGETQYADERMKAMLLCAQALWSGAFYEPALTGDSKMVQALADIRRRLGDRPAGQQDKGGTYQGLQLERYCSGILPVISAPTTLAFLKVPFRLIPASGGFRAIALESSIKSARTVPPESGLIPIGQKVHSLFFLHACSDKETHHSPSQAFGHPAGALIGEYRIRYGDGKNIVVPIRYGEHIAERRFDGDLRNAPVSYYALPAWRGTDPDGDPVTLYCYEWLNPCPEKRVASLCATAARAATDATWYVAGITILKT